MSVINQSAFSQLGSEPGPELASVYSDAAEGPYFVGSNCQSGLHKSVGNNREYA